MEREAEMLISFLFYLNNLTAPIKYINEHILDIGGLKSIFKSFSIFLWILGMLAYLFCQQHVWLSAYT